MNDGGRRNQIIIVVALLLLCCCVAFVLSGWFVWGDALAEALDIAPIN